MQCLRPFIELILPAHCLGCGQWDVTLCHECAALAESLCEPWTLLEADHGEETMPCWALGEYEGRLRNILLAAKHRDRADADVFLWRAGRTLGRAIARSTVLGRAGEYWVVPAPSRWQRRWRGREVALLLAQGAAQAISEERGERVRVVRACALKWGAGSQAGRSGAERRRGRLGTMRACVRVPADVAVVLVDDVVTTGATIREMQRVIGKQVMGVLALCRVRR